MPINLALVGYRNYHDYKSFCYIIHFWKHYHKINTIDSIISGGCSGVNKMA